MNNSKASIEKVIGESQDGRKIGDDVYGAFLQSLIDQNSHGDVAPFVDADELHGNLRYAISEFTRALKAIEPIAEKVRDMKEYSPSGPFTTLSPDEFNKLIAG